MDITYQHFERNYHIIFITNCWAISISFRRICILFPQEANINNLQRLKTLIVLLLRKENIHLLMIDYNLFKRLTPIDFVFSINLGIFEGTFIFKHVSLGDATTLHIDPEKLETFASKQLKVHFTRMHSIGMRTACLLTVSRSICLWSGGVPQIPSPG